MQLEVERKTNRYSVAYCNPQIIAQTEHCFRLTKDVRLKLEAATTQEAKDLIKRAAHNKQKNMVAIYISCTIRTWKDKNYIMCPYAFE
jgi:hypothetical protein